MTIPTLSDTQASRYRSDAPGALRSQATLEIQTRWAQNLVHGRRADEGKHPIIGLLRFAALLRPIWAGSAADDPYADWWLVRIERELMSARESIDTLRSHVEALLRGAPSVNITVAQSLQPVRVDLNFTNPYAFHGAYLLAEYDALVRAVLTARHVGLMDRQTSEKLLHNGGHAVRGAYTAAHGYRYLALTRDDMRQGTAKAAKARELLGTLPQEVLDGALRAVHAPDIRGGGSMAHGTSSADGSGDEVAELADVEDRRCY